MARSSPTSLLLPTSGGGKWRWDLRLHFFMEILFEETFFLESLRKNYFAYFEEMFSAFFEDVFLKFLRNCFGIFCGYNFFGLFQEFLAFFEEMIFSIL